MAARDVFICHSFADKAKYVTPLANALARQSVSCWVDQAEIQAGVSIIDSVSAGLKKASFVLVLITESFLSRNWPGKELNAALSREFRIGTVSVIPVVAVPKDEYFDRFPLLEDKLFLDWREGPEAIARKIGRRFNRKPNKEWCHEHPQKYEGPIWVRVKAQEKNKSKPHCLTLRWGPFIKTVKFVPGGLLPKSFLHHKTEKNRIPLLATIEPAAVVTFGQGPGPDKKVLNIDEGWTRVAGEHWPAPS